MTSKVGSLHFSASIWHLHHMTGTIVIVFLHGDISAVKIEVRNTSVAGCLYKLFRNMLTAVTLIPQEFD